jgi:hypothetical protein
MLAKPIPANVRGDLAQSVGIFTIGLAAIGFFVTDTELVPPEYIMLWILIGLGAMFIGREVHFTPFASQMRAALPGLGALFLLLGGLMLYESWPVEPMLGLTIVLWMGLAILLISLPFLKKERLHHLMTGIGNGFAVVIAVALMSIGFVLIYGQIYFGAVEVLISFPLFYYGFMKFRELEGTERRQAVLFLMFIVLLELVTVQQVVISI